MTTKTDEQMRAAFEAWAASIGLELNGRYAKTLTVLCAEEAFKAGYQAALSKENSNDRQTSHAPGCWGWGPSHYECAAREIKELLEERDALREVLQVLVNWTPSADTYRRMGFDPEVPMRAHDAAKALLAKGNKA